MSSRHRRRALAIAVLAAPAIALALWRVLPQDEVSHVSSSQALRLFRQHSAGVSRSEPAGNGWPGLGVYSYGTRGSESIDTGLLEASHDYGGVSTVTLWPGR